MRLRLTLFLTLLVTALVSAAEQIAWDANPANDVVTEYRVYYSTNSALAKPWPLMVSVPGLTATNFAAGRYYYYVTAVNSYGESDPSVVAFRPGNPSNPKVK